MVAKIVVKIRIYVVNRLKNRRGLAFALGLVLLAIVTIVSGILVYSKSNTTQARLETKLANEAYIRGNKTQALAYARKALAREPNNQNAIGFVATLTPNRAESQQLYGRLLVVYIKNSGSKYPTPITYWAEANLAEKAGDAPQAKKYYQEAIVAADASSNKYYQTVAQQSQTALKALQ